MSSSSSRIRRVACGSAVVTSAVAATIAAAPMAHGAGSLGSCSAHRNATTARGWCDGRGPDYTYVAVTQCYKTSSIITNDYGLERWAGDRRMSEATCPRGTTYKWGGLFVYYKGQYIKRVTAGW